jgi:hypothetical protein
MNESLTILHDSALGTWVREGSSLWAYPMIITLHTSGLAVLVGASIAVDLRVLGVAQRIPLSSLSQFFPVMWIGFWLNAVTGLLLFAADPRTTGIFLIKMIAVVAGVGFVLLIRRALAASEGTALNPSIRTYAMLSLLTWVVATTTGRLMAYL